MTLLAEVQAAVAADPALLQMAAAASPGDLSILHTLLDTESAAGTTLAGSADATLWARPTRTGLMREGGSLATSAPSI